MSENIKTTAELIDMVKSKKPEFILSLTNMSDAGQCIALLFDLLGYVNGNIEAALEHLSEGEVLDFSEHMRQIANAYNKLPSVLIERGFAILPEDLEQTLETLEEAAVMSEMLNGTKPPTIH